MIAFWHKAAFVGMNGSGKSELLNWLWSRLEVRRVLIDSKREWNVSGVRAVDLTALDDERARAQVEAIDWDQPIIQIRHAPIGNPGSKEQLTAVFAAIDRIPGPVNTTIHELNQVSTAAWCAPGLRNGLTGAASRQHGYWYAYQRPRHVVTEAKTEAQHAFLFPPLDVVDLVEARRGLPFLSPQKAVEWTSTVPAFGYLWADRPGRAVAIGDPLPNDLRLEAAELIRLAAGHVARPIQPSAATA